MPDPNDVSANEAADLSISPEGEELTEAEQNLVSGGGDIYGFSNGSENG